MDVISHDPAAALRRVGLRVTAPRLAVLRALADGPPHTTADAIVLSVRKRLGDSSAQTVYNVLRSLTDVGLVRRIEPAGHPGLYELRVGDNHHHLVCRTCEAVADVACAVGEAPCLTASDAAGYEIDEAEVVYWGRCPACLATEATEAETAAPEQTSPAPAVTSSALASPLPDDGRHQQRSGSSWRHAQPERPPLEREQQPPGEGNNHHVRGRTD